MSNNRYISLSELFKSIAHSDRPAIIQLMCNCGCQRMMMKAFMNLNLSNLLFQGI